MEIIQGKTTYRVRVANFIKTFENENEAKEAEQNAEFSLLLVSFINAKYGKDYYPSEFSNNGFVEELSYTVKHEEWCGPRVKTDVYKENPKDLIANIISSIEQDYNNIRAIKDYTAICLEINEGIEKFIAFYTWLHDNYVDNGNRKIWK